PFGVFEPEHLNHNRQVFDEKYAAQQRNQNFFADNNRKHCQNTSKCETSGIAHKNLCRKRVVPQKTYGCPDKSCNKNGELAHMGYVHYIEVIGINNVTTHIGQNPKRGAANCRSACCQSVEPVG